MHKKYESLLNRPEPEEFIAETPMVNEVDTSPSNQTKRRTKLFVDVLIILCLIMCAIITFNTLAEYHRLDMVLSAAEITALMVPWGGELLLIVVRQAIGSDVIQNRGGN